MAACSHFSFLYFISADKAYSAKLDRVSRKHFHDLVDVVLSMDVQVDRFGKIQTEDTHDRFGIDHISSGHEIEIVAEFCDIVYERFYLIN